MAGLHTNHQYSCFQAQTKGFTYHVDERPMGCAYAC